MHRMKGQAAKEVSPVVMESMLPDSLYWVQSSYKSLVHSSSPCWQVQVPSAFCLVLPKGTCTYAYGY